jgi:hypothetical protein
MSGSLQWSLSLRLNETISRYGIPIVFNHHHHISAMQLGHLLTRSGLTYPEVSSKVCHNSFCQLENSVSLAWVIYYEAFCLQCSGYIGWTLSVMYTICILAMLR